MTPLDPVQVAKSDRQLHLAPDYIDENENAELVDQGNEIAENERREEALGNDPEPEFDFAAEEDDLREGPLPAPELAAMHIDPLITDDAGDEES